MTLGTAGCNVENVFMGMRLKMVNVSKKVMEGLEQLLHFAY